MSAGKKKLGELLVDASIIDAEQLKTALEKQRQEGKRLGDVLVGMGALSENILTSMIAEQLHVEKIDLVNTYIDADVARLIPVEVAKRYILIPVYERGGKL
ncbi:MAG TPA: type II secretion system protein GspE, partial [Clostridia bacterium]|nr:type II secretion system protein GspE [Clostridia bacterium]